MTVTWRKDGKLIWASYQYNMKTTEDTCVLQVLNSDREEAAGTYSCEISNTGGRDVCQANVKLGTNQVLDSSFHRQKNIPCCTKMLTQSQKPLLI